MDELKQPMIVKKENYNTKPLKKELFAEVKERLEAIAEADSSYPELTNEQIANVIFSGFNTKLSEFTLLFDPKFQTEKPARD